MKRLLLSIASVLCLSVAYAQVPTTLSYQGILVDGTGVPVADGTHFVEFDLFTALTGGTQVYDGSANSVTTYKGMFTFIIGLGTGSNPVISTSIWDSQVYLQLTADAVVLSPRVQLTSNPYAFKAQNANTVVDNAITSVKITDGTIVAADLATDAVTSLKILDATIVAADIATGAVTTTEILDGTIVAADLGTGAVTSTGILDGTIAVGDLGTGSVNSTKILDGEIVNADVNTAAAIAGTKITPNFGSQNISTTGTVTATSFTGAGSGITGLTAGNISGTVAVANGGTGSTTAALARTALGVGIGTDVQAFDADLTDLADGTLTGSKVDGTTLTTVSASNITTGTLGVANGGTGATTLTGALVGNGTGAVTAVSGTASQYFRRNAGNTAYEFAALPTDVTNVSGTLPISVATGTTTPVISISQATTSTNGYLSSTDWNTFNGKANVPGSQTANTIFAAPSGSAGAPSFRGLTPLDIPNLDAGKITTGSLPITLGGTGATTAAAARSNLGLIIGTDVQAPFTATNGLTLSSNVATLGGTLTGNTTIASAGNNLMFNGTGKLGIASPTPLSKLSVGGNVAIGNTYADGTAAPNNGLIVEGLVGIGTATPSRAILEQNGAVGATAALFGGGSTGVSITQNNPGVGFNLYFNAASKAIGTGFGGNFGFNPSTGAMEYSVSSASQTANLNFAMNTRFSILANGNVGIGATPVSKLDVEGGAVIGVTYSGNTPAPANGLLVEGNVGFGTFTPNAPLSFASTVANRKIALFEQANNDHQFYGFGVNASVLRYQSVADHAFYSATSATTSNETMRITSGGSVGIGVTNPAGTRLYLNTANSDVSNSLGLYITNNYAGTSTKYGASINVSGDGDGTKYGVDCNVTGLAADASPIYGLETDVAPNGTGVAYGVNSSVTAVGTGDRYGIYNNVGSLTTNTAGIFGSFNYLGTSPALSNTKIGTFNGVNGIAATTGSVFGEYNYVNHNGTGTTYGVYANVTKAASQSGTVYGFYVDAGNDGTGTSYLYRGTSTGLTSGTEYGVYISGEDINYFSGQVGIGTSAISGMKLSVNGNAEKTGGGSWQTFSDRRVKKDIGSFRDGLSVLRQIDPVKFKYNGLAGYDDNGKEYIGVIAQDVDKVAPYMITRVNKKLRETDTSETELLMYDASALNYILVNSVKEQQTQIEELKSTVEDLKTQLNQYKDLSAQVEELKKLMAGKETGSSKSEVSGSNKK